MGGRQSQTWVTFCRHQLEVGLQSGILGPCGTFKSFLKCDAPRHSVTKYPSFAHFKLEGTCEIWTRGLILQVSKLRLRGPKELIYNCFPSQYPHWDQSCSLPTSGLFFFRHTVCLQALSFPCLIAAQGHRPRGVIPSEVTHRKTKAGR